MAAEVWELGFQNPLQTMLLIGGFCSGTYPIEAESRLK